MSFQQTHRILDEISKDHDASVKEWADKLSILIEKPPDFVSKIKALAIEHIKNTLYRLVHLVQEG